MDTNPGPLYPPPFKIGSLTASRDKMKEMADSLVALGEGASIAIDTANKIVVTAEVSHKVLSGLQAVGGAGMLVQTGVTILSQKTLQACAKKAALEAMSWAASYTASALGQFAIGQLGLTEENRIWLQRGMDAYQIFAALKFLRAQQKMRGGCFAAGTQVLTGIGTDGVPASRNIEDIRVGDWVLSRSESNPAAPLEQRQVTQVFIHTVDALRILEIQGDDGNVETIRTTDVHPFYVDGRGWVKAGGLQVGDRLQETDGTWQTLLSTVGESHPEGLTVYNLEVGGDHTYFVEDGFGAADAVWVHNANACNGLPHTVPGVGDVRTMNSFVKKLHKLGFAYEGPANDGVGFIYTNAATGQQVRIHPRPAVVYPGAENAEKYLGRHYYRSRTGSDQTWGDPCHLD